MPPPAAGHPFQVNAAANGTQRCLVGTELPRPLVARVTDPSGAPVAGFHVHFAVEKGGSHFAGGGATYEATTDGEGHAAARLVAGEARGMQLVHATFAGNTSGPAPFFALALEPAQGGMTPRRNPGEFLSDSDS